MGDTPVVQGWDENERCDIHGRKDDPSLREDNAPEQAANVAFLPGIIGSSLAMPDIHWGYGFPIGGVAAMDSEEGVISPGGIGFDINCLCEGSRSVPSSEVGKGSRILNASSVPPSKRTMVSPSASRGGSTAIRTVRERTDREKAVGLHEKDK